MSNTTSAKSGSLTELEAVTLGWVRTREPVTPYAVRVHFEQSPSARFSGSAGAIYPLMRRLERRGLLRSEAVATGKRHGRAYRVTPAGRRQLKSWLNGPLEPREMLTNDPLRTRMIYLGTLTPREREVWLDKAERSLTEQLAIIDQFAATCDELYLDLANDNARRETRARLAWIRSVRTVLDEG